MSHQREIGNAQKDNIKNLLKFELNPFMSFSHLPLNSLIIAVNCVTQQNYYFLQNLVKVFNFFTIPL